MPYAARRPCSKPMCPQLQPCSVHRVERKPWSTTTRSRRERGYGADHERMRRELIDGIALCDYCGRNVATILDHRLNRARGGTNDRSNYARACTHCSKKKTAREAHARRARA